MYVCVCKRVYIGPRTDEGTLPEVHLLIRSRRKETPLRSEEETNNKKNEI